jgi:hypothetical protein
VTVVNLQVFVASVVTLVCILVVYLAGYIRGRVDERRKRIVRTVSPDEEWGP